MEQHNYTPSRRQFLKYAGLGAAAAATGCRSYTEMRPEHAKSYDQLVKTQLGQLPKDLVAQITSAFRNPRAYAAPDVAWRDHKEVLGNERVSALEYLSELNQAVTGLLHGYPMLFHKTATALYGVRKDVAKSLELDKAQQHAFAKNFVSALVGKEQERFNAAQDAEVLLATLVGQLDKYGGRIAQLRNTKIDNAALQKDVTSLTEAFGKNAAELQNYVIARQSLLVGEGAWGDLVRKNITMHDALQRARGHESYLALGKKALSRTVDNEGKELTLNELLARENANAFDHFESQDAHYLDDINQDNRFPVVNAGFNLYAGGRMPAEEQQGLVHLVDQGLCTASTVTPESNILSTIVRYIPGITFVDGIVNGAAYMFTPNSPKGELAQVLDSTLKNYFGAASASWRVGDEDPTARFIIAMFLTAAEGALLYYGLNRNGSRSSNPRNAQGGQTTTPGIVPAHQ